MTVSNEDRDAAARVMINARMLWATSVDPAEMDHPSLAGAIVDALIAHGWGPRPAVSATEIEQRIFRTRLRAYPAQEFEAIVDAVTVAVIATGIEVTDDRTE